MSTLPTFLGVNIVTPKGVVAHQDTDALTAPGELGEMELLPGHVPLLVALRPGVLTLGTAGKARYAVSGGYLRIDQANKIEVLVDEAVAREDIDVAAAKADLATANAALAAWGDKPTDAEWQLVMQQVGWAEARIAAAGA